MGQLLLLPDARPLEEELGTGFFKSAPRRSGVYLMKDASGKVLYVGKANNLRQRLRQYRTANPDRLPRRQLRLVREVRGIEFQFCANGAAALAREASLLRTLKPKYNRAGVWPGTPAFLMWRATEQTLDLSAGTLPGPTWRRFGPIGPAAMHLFRALARLFWMVLNPDRTVAEMPLGWLSGSFPAVARFGGGSRLIEPIQHLERFCWEESPTLLAWLRESLAGQDSAFDCMVIEQDLETLQNFAVRSPQVNWPRGQLGLL